MRGTPRDIADLMECIGYSFRDPSLLERALTHGSAQDRGLASNQRLEFLGDAVLDLVISELLHASDQNLDEGRMTQSKARVVSGKSLFEVGSRWNLLVYLRVGKMYRSRDEIASSIVADAVEAVIAAVHIDGGIDESRPFVVRHFREDLDQAIAMPGEGDYKSKLSRLFQRRKLPHPIYCCADRSGPPHEPVFEVVIITGGQERTRGVGSTKQQAEQEAARLLLLRLEDS